MEAYEKLRLAADPAVCCDYGLHVALSKWTDVISSDMETLARDKGKHSYPMIFILQ